MLKAGLTKLSEEKLYRSQNNFYKNAYKTGQTPWSVDGKPSGNLQKSLKEIAQKLPNRIALDLGCGEGRHSSYLSENGFKVIGIDMQETALKNAGRRKGKGVLYILGDIFRIPVKENSFGLVIDYGVFHHIRRKDTKVFLNFLFSLLVPRGYIILTCFSRKFRHASGKTYNSGYACHHSHYDRFSSRKELIAIFSPYFFIIGISENSDGFYNMVLQKKIE